MFSPAEESAGHPVFRFREESFPMAPRLQSSFNTNFQMGRFFRYTVSVGELLSYHLDVAEYQDEDGATRRAIIHIPNDGAESESTISTDPYTLRRNAWNDLSRSVVEHTSEQAMFTGWWDNMQRLHLHTGRRGRPRYPDADVYTLPEQTAFWEKVAGGLLHSDALSCLSRQFLTVATRRLPRSRAVHGTRRTVPSFCLSRPTIWRISRRYPISPDAASRWKLACSHRQAIFMVWSRRSTPGLDRAVGLEVILSTPPRDSRYGPGK